MNKIMVFPIFILLMLAFYLIGKANYLILVTGITTPADYIIVGCTILFTAVTFNTIRTNNS